MTIEPYLPDVVTPPDHANGSTYNIVSVANETDHFIDDGTIEVTPSDILPESHTKHINGSTYIILSISNAVHSDGSVEVNFRVWRIITNVFIAIPLSGFAVQ